MAGSPFRDRGGFTLLEVLIAFAILAVAVVSLIQLTSQGLRLLKVSGDHQQAVQLADRLARDVQVDPDEVKTDGSIETGEEGDFVWERRISRVALPEEIEPATPAPGKEVPGLYTVAVAVRWGRNQQVEVATLRAPAASPPTTDQQGQNTQQGQNPAQGGTTPGAAGSGTTTTPGRSQTGSSSASGSSGSSMGSSSMGSSSMGSSGMGTTRSSSR